MYPLASSLVSLGSPAHGDLAGLLTSLATITCVAAVVTVVFQWLRQPVVLGYLLAGFLVGPHSAFPLGASAEVATTLSEIGVILLMFSLGLEFSLRRLIRIAPTAGMVAVLECSLVACLGYTVARLLGWSGYERLFAAGLVCISSTTIVARAFGEHRASGRLTELVFGILVVEDLIAIIVLAALTAVGTGAGLSAVALGATVGRLLAFLIVLIVLGMFLIPRLVRSVAKLGRAETLVIACLGIAFALALLARYFGYSVALGAFLAGGLISESGEAPRVERLVRPIRDLFAVVFFVSVGMLIEPRLVGANWPAVLLLTLTVLCGKIVGVSLGAFVTGKGVLLSVQAGLSLAQIGEFSFIIAAVGNSLGVIRGFLYPVAVTVSALTVLLTPALIRGSARMAGYVDAHLPHALQTYAGLYGTWVSELGHSRTHHATAWTRIRRLAGLLLLDAVMVAVLTIAAALASDRLLHIAQQLAHLPANAARTLLILVVLAVAMPFLLGAARLARALGLALAQEALPSVKHQLDLADAPRRALLVTLQLAMLLIAGTPLVVLVQPFLPSFPLGLLLPLAVAPLAIPFWRSATNLHGHVRAGAEVVLEALAAQSKEQRDDSASLASFRRLVPGLGEPATFLVEPTYFCVGKTLKELNVRGLTGATVLAIERKAGEVVYPSADETLRHHDLIVLIGTRDAVESARALLSKLAA